MKNNIFALVITFVLGIFFAVFIYQAVTIYRFRAVINEDHNTLIQVVNFLNTQIEASKKGTGQGNANVLYQQQ